MSSNCWIDGRVFGCGVCGWQVGQNQNGTETEPKRTRQGQTGPEQTKLGQIKQGRT